MIIQGNYKKDAEIMLYNGDCIDFIKQVPDNKIKLIITSPPYNIGKEYEKRTSVDTYLIFQEKVIKECIRILDTNGSICWQVGNYINKGEIIPLDIVLYPIFKSNGMKLRNRIIWTFGHGLHAKKRLSGRYETILWFTKEDRYDFNLDEIRVPQKYPNKKYFKGPKKGQLSCNPLGKNPGDVWDIPNVKANHVEKTIHPAQFPVELVERLILSLSNEKDCIFDPFMGVGSTQVAAIINNRKTIGSEKEKKYFDIAQKRIIMAKEGKLKLRPMGKPIYNPIFEQMLEYHLGARA